MDLAISPEELRERVRHVLPGIIELRHTLHRIPEPGHEEHQTARLLRERAAQTRLRLRPPLLKTDVVGVLDGRAPGACVLLRADIDALPLEDRTGATYASQHQGWSHACGHDGHAAMLMGALNVLNELTDRFRGHVRFVFQPAEEEKGGGRDLVQRGLLDDPPIPCAAFALHGWPGLATGRIASKPGPMMAAQDRFTVRLTGRGGHGARPHETVDPVVLAAQTILAFQTISARLVNPLRPAVLSVCTVHGGSASNVIPDHVELSGTIRHFDPETRTCITDAMERTVRGLSEAAGAHGEFELHPGYIALHNDPDRVRRAAETVRAVLGKNAWHTIVDPSMGAEDFSYFLDRIPGAMLWIGLGEDHAQLHNSSYDFEDAALENGILTYVALALETLTRDGQGGQRTNSPFTIQQPPQPHTPPHTDTDCVPGHARRRGSQGAHLPGCACDLHRMK